MSAWVRALTRPVLLGLRPVAFVLAVLGQQDQRRGVRGLGGEGEVQQDERVRVPPEADGGDVDGDPHGHEDGLDDEEPAGAEEPGDALGEAAERVRVVVGADAPAPRRGCERSSVRRINAAPSAASLRAARGRGRRRR